MAENLIVSQNESKKEKYEVLLPQIEALVQFESNLIANLANVAAALKYTFDFLWVGFYLVEDEELVLGPFQGPIACTRIKYGRGVCGKAWCQNETILVADVDKFPGHIACSSLSKSEIVVPLKVNDLVFGVLDVDSDKVNDFDEIDQHYLELISKILGVSCSL
ncbi:MAG: GAF domain-containing protein [Tannerellaceae bacterium]